MPRPCTKPAVEDHEQDCGRVREDKAPGPSEHEVSEEAAPEEPGQPDSDRQPGGHRIRARDSEPSQATDDEAPDGKTDEKREEGRDHFGQHDPDYVACRRGAGESIRPRPTEP